MLVKDLPYQRYTLESAKEAFAVFEAEMDRARTADDIVKAREGFRRAIVAYQTAASLANCRFTLDTRDEFYNAEMAYYDETGPLFTELFTAYGKRMLAAPFRDELERRISPRLFRLWEMSEKSFSPVITEDMQEENSLTTAYSKFMSEMVFTFRGERMPLSRLRGYLEDSDREVRRAAAQAIDAGLSANKDQLDDYYDRLVHVRDRMAKKMGYDNFVTLGYYRMNRLDYNADMVASFRKNVAQDLVPAVVKLKQEAAWRLGIPSIAFYDNDVYTDGEAPCPIPDTAGIFAAAREMYRDMNPEIGAFMDSMLQTGAFDVEAREGKWGGGYCTSFPAFEQTFILANFNGSSGDIDVITHEFGHALAMNYVFRNGDTELDVGGMETAECHSMSMEFLCWPYMEKFFGKNADKYRYKHLLSALTFIPYGVMVDEFQHAVYTDPTMTPAQRDALWLSLEQKYRPYMNYEGLPYLGQGTRWQYQMHIYESPFYYIDYCLAQTVALGFLAASRKDYAGTLEKYLAFSRQGGSAGFEELVCGAGLASPFRPGALKQICDTAVGIADSLAKTL